MTSSSLSKWFFWRIILKKKMSDRTKFKDVSGCWNIQISNCWPLATQVVLHDRTYSLKANECMLSLIFWSQSLFECQMCIIFRVIMANRSLMCCQHGHKNIFWVTFFCINYLQQFILICFCRHVSLQGTQPSTLFTCLVCCEKFYQIIL